MASLARNETRAWTPIRDFNASKVASQRASGTATAVMRSRLVPRHWWTRRTNMKPIPAIQATATSVVAVISDPVVPAAGSQFEEAFSSAAGALSSVDGPATAAGDAFDMVLVDERNANVATVPSTSAINPTTAQACRARGLDAVFDRSTTKTTPPITAPIQSMWMAVRPSV